MSAKRQDDQTCPYTMAASDTLPLKGVRILDLSQVLAAPFCASLLGDLGADVIKGEPTTGDLIASADEHLAPGWGAYYASINRNKRYVTMDFTDTRQREDVLRLVRDADVVIVNLRPRSREKLGLSYAALSRENPRLIYCAITGFGDSGPRSEDPGMDLVAQALGGVMGTTGEPGRAPVKASSPVGDFSAALYAVQGILAALFRREKTGRGAQISVNLLDATVAMLSNFVPQHFATGEEVEPIGGGHPQLVPYQAFEASDGYFVVACINQEFWLRLCPLLDRNDWVDDPRFRTNTERRANRGTLTAAMTDIFRQQTRRHWIDLLGGAGVPTVEINRFSEVFEDRQVLHNGTLVRVQHDEIGEYVVVRNPVLIDGEMLPVRLAVDKPRATLADIAFEPRPGDSPDA